MNAFFSIHMTRIQNYTKRLSVVTFGNVIQRETKESGECGIQPRFLSPTDLPQDCRSHVQVFCDIESNDPPITLASHHNADSTQRGFPGA